MNQGFSLNVWIVAEPIQPVNFGIFPEPGHLAFRILSGGDGGPLDRLGHTEGAFKAGQRLLVADGLECLGVPGHAAFKQSSNFVEETGFEHAAGPFVDPFNEELTRRPKAELQRAETLEWLPSLFEQPGSRLARAQADFQRANGLLDVIRVDAGGRGRIEPAKDPVQAAFASAFALQQPCAKRLIARRRLGKPFEQGTEVESGAARYDGNASAGSDVEKCLPGKSGVGPSAEHFPRLKEIEEMMGDASPLCRRRLGGADIEAAVDLQRIAVYDLASDGPGHGQSERALAGAGGSGDNQKGVRESRFAHFVAGPGKEGGTGARLPHIRYS